MKFGNEADHIFVLPQNMGGNNVTKASILCVWILFVSFAVAEEGGGESVGGELPGSEDVEVEVSVAELIARLGSQCWCERDGAMDALYRQGEEVLDDLSDAMRSTDPEVVWRAEQLVWMIRWRVSPRLIRKLGWLWEQLRSGEWRDRKRGVRYLEAFGDEDALEALGRFAVQDENPAVRRHAHEAGTRLALKLTDRLAHDVSILIRSGNQYLQRGEYDEAIRDYMTAIAFDGDNVVAHYNIACAYALRGKKGDDTLALEALEKALQLGFRDFEHIEKDKDLDPIRADPRFTLLIEKYKSEAD